MRKELERQLKRMVLEGGGTVKIAMLNPDSEKACEYGWIQDYWTDEGEPEQNLADYRSVTRRAFKAFGRIQREINKELTKRTYSKGALLLYGLDYLPTFGLDIMNPGLSDPVVYVRYYPIASVSAGDLQNPGEDRPIIRYPGEDRPIIRFDQSTPDQKYWYDFYVRQFSLHEALGRRQQQADGRAAGGERLIAAGDDDDGRSFELRRQQ